MDTLIAYSILGFILSIPVAIVIYYRYETRCITMRQDAELARLKECHRHGILLHMRSR